MNREYWVYTKNQGIKVFAVGTDRGFKQGIATQSDIRSQYPVEVIEIRDESGNYLDSVF